MTKRRKDEDEDDDTLLEDEERDEPDFDEGDPADRRKDPLRQPS